MGGGLNGYGKLWPVAAVVAVMAVVAYWQWGVKPDMSPVMSYGGKDSVVFKPDVVTEGDKTELCFKGIVWHRVCPSILTTYLTPDVGDRLDLPDYKIHTPPSMGPVDGQKCRTWDVPPIGDRSPKMTFWGFAESLCGKKDNEVRIITQMPSAKITINKRQ